MGWRGGIDKVKTVAKMSQSLDAWSLRLELELELEPEH